jgi:hypothetical protein
MIEITKRERDQLKEIIPDVYTIGTCRQKPSRGKLYVEPTKKVIRALMKIRNTDKIDV